jgi:type 1 fimbria pilin
MTKFVIAACAAVVGIAAVTATDAVAAKKVKQSCRFAGYSGRDLGVPMAQFAASTFNQIAIATAQPSFRLGGTSKVLTINMVGCPDPRTLTADQVKTTSFNPTTGLVIAYTASKNTIPPRILGLWATDEDDAGSASLTWKTFNAATNRLTGKFSANLLPGIDSPSSRNFKVRGGTFNVEVGFNGM